MLPELDFLASTSYPGDLVSEPAVIFQPSPTFIVRQLQDKLALEKERASYWASSLLIFAIRLVGKTFRITKCDLVLYKQKMLSHSVLHAFLV